MSLHIVYRLQCDCPIYNKSTLPTDVLDMLNSQLPEHQIFDFRSTSSFWTLSTDPKEVFDDAVQHLIAKQQEAKRENEERRAELFEQYRTTRKFDWDPAEFDVVGMDVKVDGEAFLRHINMHVSEAARNYRSMVEHIRLEAYEVLSQAESALLDRATRFIRDAERYRIEISALQNPKVMMDVQRDLACVQHTAKQRLTHYGMDPEQFASVMGKALADLEHYFPADFDNL